MKKSKLKKILFTVFLGEAYGNCTHSKPSTGVCATTTPMPPSTVVLLPYHDELGLVH